MTEPKTHLRYKTRPPAIATFICQCGKVIPFIESDIECVKERGYKCLDCLNNETEPQNRILLNTFNRSFAISQELLEDSRIDMQSMIKNPPDPISREQSRANRMQEIQNEIDSLEYELKKLKKTV